MQANFTSAILHVPQETIFLFTHAALWFKYQGQWADTIWPCCVTCRDVVTQFVDAVDVDDLTRPNSAILLKQLSGHMNTYWELLYHTENVEGCEKKFFSWNINKRQNKHPSKTYIIYGCRLNNLETKSTHTQSPYPSKIIMISAMKNSNWIADFIYTSSAQVQVGQWPIERGHTHRKPPPLSKQKQNN